MNNSTVGKTLSGCELLEKMVEHIITRCPEGEHLSFVGRPVYVEVANEIDGQHQRYGYMVFIRAHVVELVGRRCWIIANSIGSHGDPASPYLSDLMVVPVSNVPDTESSETLSDWARKIMVQSQYFYQSPLIVLTDQRVEVKSVGLFSINLPAHKQKNGCLILEPDTAEELAEILMRCMTR